MYIKGGYKCSFLGVLFRCPILSPPTPQIVVPSFPCGSKKTSIDVLTDLSTPLRLKGVSWLKLLSSHWRRPYKTWCDVIRIVFSLLMSPSSGGLGRPPAVREKLARTPWGRGLIFNVFTAFLKYKKKYLSKGLYCNPWKWHYLCPCTDMWENLKSGYKRISELYR